MSDLPIHELIEREKARLLSQAEAEITRDMAEFERIAVKYNIDVHAFLSIIKAAPPQGAAPSAVAHPEGSFAMGTAVAPFVLPAFDGTFGGLIDCYQVHEKSPIHQLKHSVRVNYLRSLKRLKKEIGKERIVEWSVQSVQAYFDRFASEGKMSMGHEMIGKIRLLCSFGGKELNDDACIRLSTLIGMMRLPPAESSGGPPRLTREQARKMRITAREHFGWDSIALAAALQFELPKLKWVDIIGEWVPLSDPAKSEIMKGSEKWIRGLRWSDLDDNMVLHRTITEGQRGQKKNEIEFRLSRSQMSMEEINRVPVEKRKGPMIICEFSNLPWSPNEFRRKWKIVAEKAGITPHSQGADGGDELELGAENAL